MSILHFRIVILSCLFMLFLLPTIWHDTRGIKVDTRITDIAIGNSHARAIHFGSMKLVGYNGYVGGADIRETLNQYRILKKVFPNVQRIWIPLAPVALYRDKATQKFARESQFLNNIFDMYFFWESDFVRLLSTGKDALKFFKSRIPPIEQAEDEFVLEGARHSNVVLDTDSLQNLADKTASIHAQTASLAHVANKRRLKVLVQDANKRGIEVILFIPPFTEQYFNHKLLSEFTRHYNQDLSEFSKRYDGVYFFDFNNQFGEADMRLFYDDDHLNFAGAQVFSPILFRTFSSKSSVK